MPRSWEVEYADGDRDLIFPPTLITKINGKPQLLSFRIREWHLALLRTLSTPNKNGKSLFPYWTIEEKEGQCFAIARLYYKKIAQLLDPAIDVDRLTPESRHLLFVCTEPIDSPDGEGKILGLSGLEQLMGYKIQKQSKVSVEPDNRYTTGSTELDVLTTTLLVFKGRGFQLAELLPSEDLSQMVRVANEHLSTKEENTVEPDAADEETPPDDEVFVRHKEVILGRLVAIGVNPPRGF